MWNLEKKTFGFAHFVFLSISEDNSISRAGSLLLKTPPKVSASTFDEVCPHPLFYFPISSSQPWPFLIYFPFSSAQRTIFLIYFPVRSAQRYSICSAQDFVNPFSLIAARCTLVFPTWSFPIHFPARSALQMLFRFIIPFDLLGARLRLSWTHFLWSPQDALLLAPARA